MIDYWYAYCETTLFYFSTMFDQCLRNSWFWLDQIFIKYTLPLIFPVWVWWDKLFWQCPCVLKIGNEGEPPRAAKTSWPKQVGLVDIMEIVFGWKVTWWWKFLFNPLMEKNKKAMSSS